MSEAVFSDRKECVKFFVAGNPVTQGSKRALMTNHRDLSQRRAIVVDVKADELHSWREAIAHEARRLFGSVTEQPVELWAVFLMQRPKSRPKRDTVPIGARSGDVDKLLRAVLDALTGVAYADDCQVTESRVKKRWAASGAQPGVWIWLWAL